MKGLNINIGIPKLEIDYDVFIDYNSYLDNTVSKKYLLATPDETDERGIHIDITKLNGISVDIESITWGNIQKNITSIPLKYNELEDREYKGIEKCSKCNKDISYQFTNRDYLGIK